MPWYCVLCGGERDLADFGKKPCSCGGQAVSSFGKIEGLRPEDDPGPGIVREAALVDRPLP